MKNVLRTLVITALVPVAVFAQGTKDLDAEVNAELDKMYQEQVAASSTTGNGNQTQVTTQVTVPLTLQNQPQASSQAGAGLVQKQATTVIEASPLTDSKAERIRKTRQDAELNTEQTIVEKLEQSRLEDEKRRAEALFGDKFNSLMAQQNASAVVVQSADGNGNTQTAVVAVEAAQPVALVAAPVEVQKEQVREVIVERKPEIDREAIRGEVSAALAEMNTKEEKTKASSTYISAILGAGDYPDAKNVKGQYALGVEVGQKFNDRLIVAGSFVYSNYQVQQRDGGCTYDSYAQYICAPRITDMNQYNSSALVKYQLLGGMLRPEIGGLVSYNYRTFTDTQFAVNDVSVSSQAIDMGVSTGVALEMSESFGLGLDFRYMWNLTSKADNSLQYQYGVNYLNDKAIEKMNYYTVGISAKATF